MLLKSHLQLVNCEVAVWIGVDLLEKFTQVVDFLLGQLGWDVGEDEGFELDKGNATFENLVKDRIFLKSRVRLTWGSCLVIQGWWEI